ncbi:MAG: ATP-grasp domain-containing protein [Bacteroidales bacterium]|nr:ATP-grasp domain-containing protein [Bacteroidales bacterium]
MNKFVGKKLLLLGTNVGSVDIVNYARSEGAEVFVTDFFPEGQSPAKQIADKKFQISTGDTDTLENLIRDYKINAVFAGVSEFNLLQAQALAEKTGLRFYFNRSQWDAIENKGNFRNMCQRFNVPSPMTFFIGGNPSEEELEKITYPVIVKPVDCGASIGISICNFPSEIQQAIRTAEEASDSKQIIIEQYCPGREFTAHYTVTNGKVSLSSIDNRYPIKVHEGDVTSIPLARIYPCTFIDEFIKQVNADVLKLIQSLKLDVGVVFIQGLYNPEENSFCIFESGLRCAGEAPYRFIERVNGTNFMKNIVDYLLLGYVQDNMIGQDNPYMNGKTCGVLSFVSKGGILGSISGTEDVLKSLPEVIDYEQRYNIGSVIPDGDTLHQIIFRFMVLSESRQSFVECAKQIKSMFNIYDEKKRNLCLPFDESKFLK